MAPKICTVCKSEKKDVLLPKVSIKMCGLNYSNKFKARVALEAICEQKTLSELSREYEVCVNQFSLWKQEAIRNMELSFGGSKFP